MPTEGLTQLRHEDPRCDSLHPRRRTPGLPAAGLLRRGRAPAAPPSRLSAHDARVDALLAQMTLEEKIGQMTQAEQHQLKDEDDIETYFLGSRALAAATPTRRPTASQDWTDIYDRYQARGPQDAPARSRSSTASTPSTATTTCWAP